MLRGAVLGRWVWCLTALPRVDLREDRHRVFFSVSFVGVAKGGSARQGRQEKWYRLLACPGSVIFSCRRKCLEISLQNVSLL